MIDLKQLAGVLNTDDDQYTIPGVHHKMGNNIRFRGTGKNLRAENVPGTRIINNPYLPAGTNQTIGFLEDQVNQRSFVFNYNSNGNHGIYIEDTVTENFAPLLIVGSATDGDILNFDPDVPIHSINILYSEVADGNILFYIDSLLRPTAFNIDRYLSNPYPVTKRAFIDVAKAPPIMPPRCTYCNDFTVSVNNLKNSLFQFKEKFVFDDFQKSVISSGSIVPLPIVPFGTSIIPDVISNPHNNARIDIYIQTGDIDVKKLEIWGRQVSDSGSPNQTTDTASSDYFLIKQLDKEQLLIPDNSIYCYRFYNDGVYPAGDLKENTLLQDWVPREANTQELLNGNVPIYGGIKEGYDPVPININISASNETTLPRNTYNGLLFFAAQTGADSGGAAGDNITIYLTGCGENDISGNPNSFLPSAHATAVYPLNNDEYFVVDCATSGGVSKKFQYHLVAPVPSDLLISSILSQLATAAIGQGFSLVSTGTNSITISQSNIVLYGSQVINNATGTNLTNNYQYLSQHFAYPHQSAEDYAIMYFDEKGKTNGASVLTNTLITTQEDITGTTMPLMQLTITSRPPLWARYYQIVRAENLTYNKHLFWVSNQTFYNVDLDSNITYAYIGITNMTLYNENNQAATPVVNYDFAAGDRIRFEQRYPIGGSATNVGPYDYEIVSVAINPLLNGVPQTGRFIKIQYPTQDIVSGIFEFSGDDFQNYKILIYNYIKHSTDATTETYFEFGRQYGIGNAGTVNAFHIGSDQTQSSDLVTPAIIRMDEGNFFYRFRNVPAGGSYYMSGGPFGFSNQYATFITGLTTASIVNANYTINSQAGFAAGLLATDYPKFTDVLPLFQNTSSASITIRVRGTVQIHAVGSTYTSIKLKILTSTGVTIVPIVARFAIPMPESLEFFTLPFDGYAQVPTLGKCWILAQNGLQVVNLHYEIFTMQLDVIQNITIPIIEPSYSDNLNIVINSNSRPSVFDPNAREIYYPTLARYGLPFQLGTNINQTNRFYPQNYDEYDRGKGDVRRFKVRERIMRVFQDRACGSVNIYAKYIVGGDNKGILSITNDIITQNNIDYYEGNYGLGGYPTSLVSTKIADYFPDPVHGYLVRLSKDGQIPISELYKGQFYIRSLITPYNRECVKADGSKAFMLGTYNYLEEEYVTILQGGTSGGHPINDYAFSFNEKRNAFTSFYDFRPDWVGSVNETMVSFVQGQMYMHDSPYVYNNFYGTQYDASITLVFNSQIATKKAFMAIAYQSNKIWESSTPGDVQTSMVSPQTGLQQISKLFSDSYEVQENIRYAPFLYDMNSSTVPSVALWEGDVLRGNWIEVKLTYVAASELSYLYTPYISYGQSPRNY